MTKEEAIECMEKELTLTEEMLLHNQKSEGVVNQFLAEKSEWMKMAMNAISKEE